MPDPSLNIVIKTEADLTALQKYRKEFGEQITAMKGRADALTDNTKKSEVLDDATKKLSTSNTGLRGIIQRLSLEFPLLASAVSSVLNPLTLLVTAIGLASRAFTKYIDEQRAAAQKQVLTEAIEDQIGSLERYKRKLKEAGDENKDFNAQLEREVDLQQQLADKQLTLEKLRIQSRVARGEISDIEGVRLTGELEGRAEGETAQRQIGLLKTKLVRAQNLAAAPLGQAPDAEAVALRNEALAKARAAGAQKDFVGDSETRRKLIEELQAELAAFKTTGALVPNRAVFALQNRLGPQGIIQSYLDQIANIEEQQATDEAYNEDRQRVADEASGRAKPFRARAAARAQIPGLQSEIAARSGLLAQSAPIDAAIRSTQVGIAGAKEASALVRQTESELQRAQSELIQAVVSGSEKSIQKIEDLSIRVKELNARLDQINSRQADHRN